MIPCEIQLYYALRDSRMVTALSPLIRIDLTRSSVQTKTYGAATRAVGYCSRNLTNEYEITVSLMRKSVGKALGMGHCVSYSPRSVGEHLSGIARLLRSMPSEAPKEEIEYSDQQVLADTALVVEALAEFAGHPGELETQRQQRAWTLIDGLADDLGMTPSELFQHGTHD